MKHSPFNLTVQIYILNIETKGNVGIYTLYTIQLVAVPLQNCSNSSKLIKH